MKSFNFIAVNGINEPTPEFYPWTIGGQNFWIYDSRNAVSILEVQGFKNINIFKIEVNGNVYTDADPAGVCGIVNNWHVILTVDGQNSNLSSGNITAGGFNMFQQPLNPNLIFTQYQNSMDFVTPIQSASKITISTMYAAGIANQSNVSIKLRWWLYFTVFYKFEGED